MKARYHLLALFAVCLLTAPGVFAQRSPDGGGPPGQDNNGVPHVVTSRIFTTATLQAPSGLAVSGKVRTATIQSEVRGLQQGLRLKVTGLTPSTEYSLVIDSTLVGTGVSSATGVLKMAFALPATGRATALPEAITPIATARVVQLFAGQTLVASGEFRGGPRGGGDDGR